MTKMQLELDTPQVGFTRNFANEDNSTRNANREQLTLQHTHTHPQPHLTQDSAGTREEATSSQLTYWPLGDFNLILGR